MSFLLYSYWRSSCSYRVRIALNLKEIPYQTRAVHLVKDGGEQYKPDYLELNPMGRVPTLVHEGRALTESMAIMEYLEALEAYPAFRLFPFDQYTNGLVREFCETINTGIQPIQNLSVLKELVARFQIDDDAKKAWAHDWIARGFQVLERRVADHARSFCFGDMPTAADCFLIPQIYNANRFGVDMQAFPTLARVDEHALTHPAFALAHPDQQPDAPRQNA